MEPTEPPVEYPVEPPVTESEVTSTHSKITIRNYSNVIFLYPTWLVALGCALAQRWSDASLEEPGGVGFFFTAFFFVNLSVLVFEYSRIASLLVVVSITGLGFLSHGHPEVTAFIREVADQPIFMSSSFYWAWVVCFTLIFMVAVLRARVDYWSIEGGELLHRKKPFRVVEKWPLEGMEVTGEVNDVLEYLLFRSGRVVLMPAGSDRVVVIENVPGVTEIEARIREALGQSPSDD